MNLTVTLEDGEVADLDTMLESMFGAGRAAQDLDEHMRRVKSLLADPTTAESTLQEAAGLLRRARISARYAAKDALKSFVPHEQLGRVVANFEEADALLARVDARPAIVALA